MSTADTEQAIRAQLRQAVEDDLVRRPPRPLVSPDQYVPDGQETSSRRRGRPLAVAAAVSVLLVAGGLAWRANSDTEPQEVAATSAEGETFTVVYPEVEPVRVTEMPNLPPGDPLLDAIEIGWIPVTPPGELPIGFIPTAFFLEAAAGEVVETIDADGRRIGYWTTGLGYVEADVFEDDAFDWKAAMIEKFGDPTMAEERIAIIEATGGLGPVQEAEASEQGRSRP